MGDLSGTPLEGFTVKELDVDAGSYDHPIGFDAGTLYLNFKDVSPSGEQVGLKAGKPYILKTDAIRNAADLKLTATAGTRANKEQGCDKLLDNQDSSQWYTDKDCKESPDDPYYCEFNALSVVTLTGYTLTVAPNTALSDRLYNPAKWTLKAKLTAEDARTVIDSRDATENAEDALPDKTDTEHSSKTYTIAPEGSARFRVSETKKLNQWH